MATAIIPNNGETKILNIMFKGTQDYSLELYESNTTPAETDNNLTHTVCSGSGYSSYVIPINSWSVSGTIASASSHEFTFTGAKTVYGVLLKDNVNNVLISAMRFDNPQVIGASGGSIIITPKFTLQEEA